MDSHSLYEQPSRSLGAGGMVGGGVVRPGGFGGSAREGGGRALLLNSVRLVAACAGEPRPAGCRPGGYKVGEKVFFAGANETFATGDKVVHGQQGEVVGPSTLENYKGKGVKVLFPGNKANVSCLLTTVRRLRAASACDTPAH